MLDSCSTLYNPCTYNSTLNTRNSKRQHNNQYVSHSLLGAESLSRVLLVHHFCWSTSTSSIPVGGSTLINKLTTIATANNAIIARTRRDL